ncbi:MAG: 3-keto-disaccharide hydrolase [Cyclobacteriaceae bacterium]
MAAKIIISLVLFLHLHCQVANGQMLFDGNHLGNWEIANYGTQGEIYIEDDAIILGVGDGLTGITWSDTFPTDNYRISLQAKKINGSDFFCGLTFPVRNSHCTFIVGGWGGALVGLSNIDGLDASQNDYQLYRNFVKDRWYKIGIQVEEGIISAYIDDEEVIRIDSDDHDIGIRADIALSTPVGISAWNTKSAIKNIKLVHLP